MDAHAPEDSTQERGRGRPWTAGVGHSAAAEVGDDAAAAVLGVRIGVVAVEVE